MLILVVGLLGLVALPFLILLAPLLMWFLVPAALGLASLGAVRAVQHHQHRRAIPAHP
ncbi:MAG TPA: hypothetical protein VFH73_01885 [Polyangia bacterium]|jgi:hypothetical protein|nr:hypothetical protein [Polyangia bacterium]